MLFSLIGSGFIMPRHAEAIHSVGGGIAGVYNTVRGSETWREALVDPHTDAIVILAPNDLHVQMALEAARHGKRVLCEKPLGVTSESVRELLPYSGVSTVLQLRHHPLVDELRAKGASGRKTSIDMNITVFRDAEYFSSWKGDASRSGGILLNIGIHYFDLLLHVFGTPTYVRTDIAEERVVSGVMDSPSYRCTWTIRIDKDRSRQCRRFRVDGKDYDFSAKDNLSHENLHRHVYRDFMEGKGVTPRQALTSVEFVETLYASVKSKT